MKRKQRNLNLLRLLVYCTELNDLVNREFDELLLNWFKENNGHEGIIYQFENNFEDELYQNVWATILEDELQNYNSNLGRLADFALPSNKMPFGYRLISQHPSTLELFDIEANIVRLIFHWYVNLNFSLRKIAKNLTQMQVPTPADIWMQAKKKYGRAVWHSSFIRTIINSKTYTGRWQYYDQFSERKVGCQVPAIVSDEIYKFAQEALSKNKNSPSHSLKYDFLLANRVHCEVCGTLTRLQSNKYSSGKTYRYYRCPTKKCETRGFQSNEIDEIAWEWLKSKLLEHTQLKKLRAVYQTKIDTQLSDLQERLRVVDCYLAHYEDKLNRLLQTKLPKHFLEEEFEFYCSYLSDAIRELKKSRAQLHQWFSEKTSTPTISLDVADNDLDLRRNIVELLHVHIWIRGRNQNRLLKISSNLGTAKIKLSEKKNEKFN